ncbi:MAG TPA: iron-containing redox enzyme family protein [Nevskiaceae bacterium]|nr:iron-containing redox enzyme family protein [Nevskiaceae bacterium]
MDLFDQLLAATAADQRRYVLDNPLFALVASGQATRDQYVVYLRETYYLVRHTSRALARAASHVDDDQRALRAWLVEQANEEHGHEQFCLKDLHGLGLDATAITSRMPGPGAWGVVTQNYFFAGAGHPEALLGVASATEGMGAQLAGDLASVLIRRYGIPERATTFLRSHAGFDQRHYEQARDAVNRCGTAASLPWIEHGRRMTFFHYGGLFREVAASTERFFALRTAHEQPESTHA